ncbi:TetR/AcrR family transcriptional regulator [Nocardioides mangrovicus]|uniref:TetR/AcrR family transcriptional regulator n=1 Tax=Nocardioides mangrovicus TaxID=2478913 RepID=A0A3L8NX15_9ACTN|nr:TetR/AcrR family transcriptional regulator [Nocardioides mangrovicus]RLV47796.1 TetR/AcrR family transcriptional regulator [Nocardioides mangrovicus]
MSGNRPGRPRSRAVDRSVHEAAWALLAEGHARDLSLEQVAQRAGVATSSVYRRYRSVDDLLGALMEEVYAEVPVADTGSVEEDLSALMLDVVGAWSPPERRRGFLVALVAAQEDNADLAEAYGRQLRARREQTTRILTRGVERGEVRSDVDAELVMELLAGLTAQRLLVSRRPFTEKEARAVVDLVLNGVRGAR